MQLIFCQLCAGPKVGKGLPLLIANVTALLKQLDPGIRDLVPHGGNRAVQSPLLIAPDIGSPTCTNLAEDGHAANQQRRFLLRLFHLVDAVAPHAQDGLILPRRKAHLSTQRGKGTPGIAIDACPIRCEHTEPGGQQAVRQCQPGFLRRGRLGHILGIKHQSPAPDLPRPRGVEPRFQGQAEALCLLSVACQIEAEAAVQQPQELLQAVLAEELGPPLAVRLLKQVSIHTGQAAQLLQRQLVLIGRTEPRRKGDGMLPVLLLPHCPQQVEIVGRDSRFDLRVTGQNQVLLCRGLRSPPGSPEGPQVEPPHLRVVFIQLGRLVNIFDELLAVLRRGGLGKRIDVNLPEVVIPHMFGFMSAVEEAQIVPTLRLVIHVEQDAGRTRVLLGLQQKLLRPIISQEHPHAASHREGVAPLGIGLAKALLEMSDLFPCIAQLQQLAGIADQLLHTGQVQADDALLKTVLRQQIDDPPGPGDKLALSAARGDLEDGPGQLGIVLETRWAFVHPLQEQIILLQRHQAPQVTVGILLAAPQRSIGVIIGHRLSVPLFLEHQPEQPLIAPSLALLQAPIQIPLQKAVQVLLERPNPQGSGLLPLFQYGGLLQRLLHLRPERLRVAPCLHLCGLNQAVPHGCKVALCQRLLKRTAAGDGMGCVPGLKRGPELLLLRLLPLSGSQLIQHAFPIQERGV